MSPHRFRLLTAVIILTIPFMSLGLERSGSAAADEYWRRADSPVYIAGIFTVPLGSRLTIEPGVEVRFQANSGLNIQGDLVAVGAPDDSIRFTSAGERSAGAWKGITFRSLNDAPAYDDDGNYIGSGSIMDYCVVEYAGQKVSETSAALEIITVSPLIKRTSIRASQAVTGTIRCSQNAAPLICDSHIEGNRAVRGGALSSDIGAHPMLLRNWIGSNTADDNGGALYVSLGDLTLRDNFIYSNLAGASGGALYAARSNSLVIEGNHFRANSARERAATILLTEKVTAVLSQNAFEQSADYIYLEKAKEPVEASRNWWGAPPTQLTFGDLIRDRKVDAAEPLINIEPLLWAPPEKLLTNPYKTQKIIVCRDDDYNLEIPFGVAECAPLRLRLDAVDINPLFQDVVRARLTSTLDPQGIVVPLTETTASSGIFTFKASVGLKSNQEKYIIGDRDGGHIDISTAFAPDIHKQYPTLPALPIISDFAIADIVDISHMTDHKPRFAWSYFEVVERPQKLIKVVVTDVNSDASVWNSGEVKSSHWQIIYDGQPLQDGETYNVTLNVSSGKYWSEPSYLQFRMNSLPTAPEPLLPEPNSIMAILTPLLSTVLSSDPEGDELLYELEIFRLQGAEAAQSIFKVQPGISDVQWTPEPLEENGAYRFHGRALDPFEAGPWSAWRTFYVNTIEEPPAAFDLISPVDETTIYDLWPELTWRAASDPDPLASLTYTVEIGTSASLVGALRYSNISDARFKLPDALSNLTDYYWRVTAVDNTGRSTYSSSVGRFKVDTTPSIPMLAAPLNGEERKPEANLTWNVASDPDPRDKIVYDLRVYETSRMDRPVAQVDGCETTYLPVNQLNGWEMLVDNHIYYWQVRARDNHNYSSDFSGSGSFFFNRFNDTPSMPMVNAPRDTVTKTNDILFAWQPSSDPDLSDPPSTLTYDIQLTTSTFDAAAKTFASRPGADNLSIKLDDNMLWHYRVRSRDDEGAVSDWTDPRSVLVNIAEDPPTPFDLNSPVKGAVIAAIDSLDFSWNASRDVDYGSSARYRLEIIAPNGRTFTYETPQTQWLFRETLENETHYRWRVFAIDNIGLTTVCRSEFTFRTNSTPSAPRALTAAGAILKPDHQLSWSASSDPDRRDIITYQAQVSGDSKFIEILAHRENIERTQVNIRDLEGFARLKDNLKRYWRVRAIDQRGFYSGWSPISEVVLNLRNDVPGDFNLLSPANRDTLNDLAPTLKWQAARDPDPAARVTYTVAVARDADFSQFVINARALSGTSFKIPEGALERGAMYYWKITAEDDEGASTYGSNSDADPWRFYIKTLPSK